MTTTNTLTNTTTGTSAAGSARAPANPIKETLTSITIAFAMAFVFRGFVVEGFVIPTGSMAPTLMGQHVRLQSDDSGYDWPVGPWYYYPGTSAPLPVQGGLSPTGDVNPTIETFDPMTQGTRMYPEQKLTAGDRVFVLKYLKGVYDPARWDVVVFKNPQSPQENFIKRLLGLPGEQVTLVDGDVFVRPTNGDAGQPATIGGVDAWREDGWTVARKPERVQRELWYPLFDSLHTPSPDAPTPFRPPWSPSNASSWQTDTPSYVYSGSGPTELAWDTDAWPITDLVSYNVSTHPSSQFNPMMSRLRYNAAPLLFPVSDLRSSFEIVPEGRVSLAATLEARGHEFRVRIDPEQAGDAYRAALEMRPLDADGGTASAAWTGLGQSEAFDLPQGRATQVDVWFVDQSLQLWIGAERVALGDYAWSPADRVLNSTGSTIDALIDLERGSVDNQFALNRNYRTPEFSWSFDGGPFTLHRVRLERDQHYQATPHPRIRAWGTHPDHFPSLGPAEFFVCGDNSASSDDGRLWTSVDPWVRDLVGEGVRPGVVPGEMMVGKAWVVYLPAPLRDGIKFSLDFGRMRWIW